MGTLRPGRMNAPGITEPTEVITRARAGDAEAWGELYHDYAPAIFRFCRRALPTREDAEDATMEIFMKLKGKLVQYDATRSFSAWLYKVSANHCWDMLRRRKMRWECGAPLWAWCCCVPGTNCGKRWKATRRWQREELHEQNA